MYGVVSWSSSLFINGDDGSIRFAPMSDLRFAPPPGERRKRHGRTGPAKYAPINSPLRPANWPATTPDKTSALIVDVEWLQENSASAEFNHAEYTSSIPSLESYIFCILTMYEFSRS
jgi:hypothetical protein